MRQQHQQQQNVTITKSHISREVLFQNGKQKNYKHKTLFSCNINNHFIAKYQNKLYFCANEF